jgi:hypothetical protein
MSYHAKNGTWYPCYRFNRSGQSVRVEDEHEDVALDGDWFDTPPSEESEPMARDAADDRTDDVDTMLAEESRATSGATFRNKKKRRG